jgi:hypothetical protein
MLDRLIRDRDWPALALFERDRFGADVDPLLLQLVCGELPYVTERDTDPGWTTRLECTLGAALPIFRDGRRGAPPVALKPPLHVLVVALDEAPGRLDRLRHLDAIAGSAPAASKVFKPPLVPRPINRVAARVAPEPA